VGHSYGGALIRVFAHLFPTEVCGLVFIDPLTEDLLKGMGEAERKQIFASVDSSAAKSESIGEKAEWPYMRQEALTGFPELKTFPLPDVPTAVLIAGQLSNWVTSKMDWYASSFTKTREASLQVIPFSSHYIHLNEPDLVVTAIKRVVYPDAKNALLSVLKTQGVDSALAHYRKMRASYPPEWVTEDVLNTVGHLQLSEGNTEQAIAFLKMNVELHPDVYSTHHSLGEAYQKAGDKDLAVKAFQKSLQLNPANTKAAKALNQLKEK
jgi:tetratricopeptide (TPR) repeat protein